MTFKKVDDGFWVSPQLSEADVAQAAADGVRTIISNRPDGEEPGQLPAARFQELAAQHGMAFVHIPVAPSQVTDAAVARMAAALAAEPRPVLAFCRSGMRAATLWALSQSGREAPEALIGKAAAAGYDLAALRPRLQAATPVASRGPSKSFDVVIVGGGSAGIATAMSLLRRQPDLSIAVIEPAEDHFYQPGWTMVGAGVFRPDVTRRPMAAVMPSAVTWLRTAVTGFAPETREVIVAGGDTVRYRVLVAAPGIKLDWTAIPGLPEALGRNNVTSNYRFDLAPYTYQVVQSLGRGRAIFTQPPMPIKCAGAPQKALYLSCDHWSRAGALPNMQVSFHNAGNVLFGVAAYVPALMEYIRRYGVALEFESKLVAVDGAARSATFERRAADGTVTRVEEPFDMLHAVPPQCAPDFVRSSPLAAASGYIDVDPATMRHVRYPEIFALGDACSTSNAKTAAAARKQAPVVAVNVLAALSGKPPEAAYDGYGSCPLTVERGRIVLAEFGYGGKLLPSFPHFLIDGTKPSRLAWFLKDRVLPIVYWQAMLKGREWMASPQPLAPAARA